MTPKQVLTARLSALKSMCDQTGEILDEVIEHARSTDSYGLAVAASHLKDSLLVFGRECERQVIKEFP
jgi:hypothetical protein